MKTVEVPDALVEFMQYVVDMLDSSEEDDRGRVDGDDGLQDDHAVGGRDASGVFKFDFWPIDRDERWRMRLLEADVRSIAAGLWPTVPVEVHEASPRAVPPAPVIEPVESAGRAMLEALVGAKLVVLEPRARLDDLAEALERIVIAELDHPKRSDAERATNIVEGIVDLAGIEDVFGDELEILETVRRFAE